MISEARHSDYALTPAAVTGHRAGVRQGLARPFSASAIMLAVYMFTVIAWSEASTQSAQYSRLAGLGLTLVFVLEFLWWRRRAIALPLEAGTLALFVLWNLYSLFWADDHFWAFVTIKTLFQLLVLWFVSLNIMVCYGSTMPASIGILAGLGWAMFSSISANGMSLTEAPGVRVGSLLTNANAYAVALTVGVLTSVYLYPVFPRVGRWVLVVFSVLAVQQVFFATGSRKGMIGVVLVFGIYFAITVLLNSRHKPGHILLFLLGIVAAYFVVTWLITASPFGERLYRIEEDPSFATREDLFGFAIREWTRAPFIGHGSNQFRELLERHLGIATYSHSNYSELLVNTGLIGLALFYSVYALIAGSYAKAYRVRQVPTRDIAWAFTLIVVFLLWDVAMVSYSGKLCWIMLAQLAARRELLQSPGNTSTLEIGTP